MASRGPAIFIEYGRYDQWKVSPAHFWYEGSSCITSYVLMRVGPSMSPGCVGPQVGCTRMTEFSTSFCAYTSNSKCALCTGLRFWKATTALSLGRLARTSAGDLKPFPQ